MTLCNMPITVGRSAPFISSLADAGSACMFAPFISRCAPPILSVLTPDVPSISRQLAHGVHGVLQQWRPCAPGHPPGRVKEPLYNCLQVMKSKLSGLRFQHNHSGPHGSCASDEARADDSQQALKTARLWWDLRRQGQLYGPSHVAAVRQKLQGDPHVQPWFAAECSQPAVVLANDPVLHRCWPENAHAVPHAHGTSVCLDPLQSQQQFKQAQPPISHLPAGACSFSHSRVRLSSRSVVDTMNFSSGEALENIDMRRHNVEHQHIFPTAVRSISWPGCGTLFFWQLGVMSHFCKVGCNEKRSMQDAGIKVC